MDDVFETWRERREREGPSVTLVDLYRMVADARGLQPSDLPVTERRELWKRAASTINPGIEFMLGSDRPREPIEAVPYDPAWPATFERWRARLRSCLGDVAARIEHVGSTSVPGLDAKPVVDIQVSVADLLDEHHYVPGCEAAGLMFRLRDDAHRYFRPPFDQPRVVHVHVCAVGSAWERDHLLFRDFLRTHPDACDEYAATKRKAAALWRDDSMGYTETKSDFILPILDAAEQWAQLTGWRV
jgi:GrpB-like predicted nucleotidyltransferase (UPF0157 family)